MNPGVTFDSIESAHEFVSLFADVVIETKHDVEADLQREVKSKVSRRTEALQIVLYNLGTLELHLKKSRRILNDLRSLRRLLLGERTNRVVAVRPESTRMSKARSSSSIRSSELNRPSVSPYNGVARDASLCAKIKKRALSTVQAANTSSAPNGDEMRWYVRKDSKIKSGNPPEMN